MIIETGRVVAVEDSALWVQTIRKSACAQCSVKKGCGQALLAQMGQEPGFVKVTFDATHSPRYVEGTFVRIGIEENVMVKSALLLYLLPLILMLLGIALSAQWFESEAVSALVGLISLGLGAVITRYILEHGARRSELEPVLIGPAREPENWPSVH